MQPDAGAGTTEILFFVAGLQVQAPVSTRVIVPFGDSITDGADSTVDGNAILAGCPVPAAPRAPKLHASECHQHGNRLESTGCIGAGKPLRFDAVIDLEKVVRDPANPVTIRPELTDDFVHPNSAGYRLMGEAIDLTLFE